MERKHEVKSTLNFNEAMGVLYPTIDVPKYMRGLSLGAMREHFASYMGLSERDVAYVDGVERPREYVFNGNEVLEFVKILNKEERTKLFALELLDTDVGF